MPIRRIALVLAAAALWAGGLLAPSVAAAHPQYMHASHAAAVPAHANPTTDVIKQDAARPAAVQELTAAPENPASVPDSGACADRGCCSNGACTACCSIVAPVVVLTFPPSLSSVLFARDGPMRAALAVEGPSRPPKHFA